MNDEHTVRLAASVRQILAADAALVSHHPICQDSPCGTCGELNMALDYAFSEADFAISAFDSTREERE